VKTTQDTKNVIILAEQMDKLLTAFPTEVTTTFEMQNSDRFS
jgi:hypothetical protein